MNGTSEDAVQTYERTFTNSDVRAFADVSRDRQPRHLEPDEDGRLMVHGLLTATLPTKLGGDSEVLASRMDFQFHRPVYTGETVHCRTEREQVTEREDRYDVVSSVECTVDGTVVMDGTVEGVIYKGRDD